jgi:hypothetical protein
MSRRAIQIGEEDIETLSLQVQHTFDAPIKTKKNIHDLIDAITKQNQKDVLSLNTLRRFFKLIPSNHTPTIETLNILSRYCGYSSWDEFTYVANQNSENLLGHSMIQMLRQKWSKEYAAQMIRDYARSEKLYYSLAATFPNLQEKDKIFLINHSLENIISPQYENSALGYAQYFWIQTVGCYLLQLQEHSFLKVIPKIKHRKIIAEICVSYNTCEKNYDHLLTKTNSLFESQQDQFFLRSVIIFRSFLSSKKWTDHDLQFIKSLHLSPDQLDIKPFSRLRALQILAHHKEQSNIATIESDVQFFKRNKFYRESIVFYFIEIARALCYCSRHEDAIALFEEYNNLYQGNIGFWASIHRNTLHLYASWAYAKNNNRENALIHYNLFNPSLIENFQEECIKNDLAKVKKLLR